MKKSRACTNVAKTARKSKNEYQVHSPGREENADYTQEDTKKPVLVYDTFQKETGESFKHDIPAIPKETLQESSAGELQEIFRVDWKNPENTKKDIKYAKVELPTDFENKIQESPNKEIHKISQQIRRVATTNEAPGSLKKKEPEVAKKSDVKRKLPESDIELPGLSKLKELRRQKREMQKEKTGSPSKELPENKLQENTKWEIHESNKRGVQHIVAKEKIDSLESKTEIKIPTKPYKVIQDKKTFKGYILMDQSLLKHKKSSKRIRDIAKKEIQNFPEKISPKCKLAQVTTNQVLDDLQKETVVKRMSKNLTQGKRDDLKKEQTTRRETKPAKIAKSKTLDNLKPLKAEKTIKRTIKGETIMDSKKLVENREVRESTKSEIKPKSKRALELIDDKKTKENNTKTKLHKKNFESVQKDLKEELQEKAEKGFIDTGRGKCDEIERKKHASSKMETGFQTELPIEFLTAPVLVSSHGTSMKELPTETGFQTEMTVESLKAPQLVSCHDTSTSEAVLQASFYVESDAGPSTSNLVRPRFHQSALQHARQRQTSLDSNQLTEGGIGTKIIVALQSTIQKLSGINNLREAETEAFRYVTHEKSANLKPKESVSQKPKDLAEEIGLLDIVSKPIYSIWNNLRDYIVYSFWQTMEDPGVDIEQEDEAIQYKISGSNRSLESKNEEHKIRIVGHITDEKDAIPGDYEIKGKKGEMRINFAEEEPNKKVTFQEDTEALKRGLFFSNVLQDMMKIGVNKKEETADELQDMMKIGVKKKGETADDSVRLQNIAVPDSRFKDFSAMANLDKPEIKYYEGECLSGFFNDGVRRADLVLVLNKENDDEEVHEIKLDFLVGLVKMGVQMEFQLAKLRRNRLVFFVKLHATDKLLETYCEILSVKRYHWYAHMKLAHMDPSTSAFWKSFVSRFKHSDELPWLKLVWQQYREPLKLSFLDRSYILYTLLQHKTFGDPQNYYSIHRMQENKLLTDAFALHDGPAQVSPDQEAAFNCRQILNYNWFTGFDLYKDQPIHLIYEYFGSRMAMYFALFDVVNKALLVASLWGIFMMVIYLIKDGEYMAYTRDFACNALMRDTKTMVLTANNEIVPYSHRFYLMNHSVICAECEGEKGKLLCPYTIICDYCLDFYIMMFFDSPYMVIHSAGIALLAVMVWSRWRHQEPTLLWLWEEYPKRPPLNRPQYFKYLYSARNVKGVIMILNTIFQRFMIYVILPLLILAIPVVVIGGVFIGLYRTTRKWSVSEVKPDILNVTLNLVPVKVDKAKEYGILIATVAIVQVILLGAEKYLHTVSVQTTEMENHRTQDDFDKSLAWKFFIISFFYSSFVVIYFCWFKGAFHWSPLSAWSPKIKYKTLSSQFTVTLMQDLYLSVARFVRRALSLNCGPFSCFRQGVVAFIVVIFVRIIAYKSFVTFNMYMRVRAARARNRVPVCEQELQFKPITEQDIHADYNNLLSEFALVMLFAPVCPLAPLVLLLFNMLQHRWKCNEYLVVRRRPLLERGRGLSSWRYVLTFVCLAVPLFHGLTIARTEIFKKYTFYIMLRQKKIRLNTSKIWNNYTDKVLLKPAFMNFLLSKNYYFDKVNTLRPKFMKSSLKRVRDVFQDNISANNTPLCYAVPNPKNNANWFSHANDGCRSDNFFDFTLNYAPVKWPNKRNIIYEEGKASYNVHSWEQYHLLYIKTMFVLLYMICFTCVVLLAMRWRSRVAQRLKYREQTMQDMRFGEMLFIESNPPKPLINIRDRYVAMLLK